LLQGFQGLTQAKVTPPERLRQARVPLAPLSIARGQKDKADEWRKQLEAVKPKR
jgi:hypothetical protein